MDRRGDPRRNGAPGADAANGAAKKQRAERIIGIPLNLDSQAESVVNLSNALASLSASAAERIDFVAQSAANSVGRLNGALNAIDTRLKNAENEPVLVANPQGDATASSAQFTRVLSSWNNGNERIVLTGGNVRLVPGNYIINTKLGLKQPHTQWSRWVWRPVGSGYYATGSELLVNTNAGEAASTCLLYTSPSPRDLSTSRMPSSA